MLSSYSKSFFKSSQIVRSMSQIRLSLPKGSYGSVRAKIGVKRNQKPYSKREWKICKYGLDDVGAGVCVVDNMIPLTPVVKFGCFIDCNTDELLAIGRAISDIRQNENIVPVLEPAIDMQQTMRINQDTNGPASLKPRPSIGTSQVSAPNRRQSGPPSAMPGTSQRGQAGSVRCGVSAAAQPGSTRVGSVTHGVSAIAQGRSGSRQAGSVSHGVSAVARGGSGSRQAGSVSHGVSAVAQGASGSVVAQGGAVSTTRDGLVTRGMSAMAQGAPGSTPQTGLVTHGVSTVSQGGASSTTYDVPAVAQGGTGSTTQAVTVTHGAAMVAQGGAASSSVSNEQGVPNGQVEDSDYKFFPDDVQISDLSDYFFV